MELLALVTAGDTTLWYARGRFGDSGTLVEGELGIGPDNNNLIRLREGSQGGDLLINHDSSSVLGFATYFGAGGAGEDLTLHIQLSATDVYSVLVTDNLKTVGGGYATINLIPSGGRQAINDVDVGDRVIIAFTRPANAAPAFADDSYSRSVSETALVGATVGTPITATDANGDTLGYGLSGTGAADFAVSTTGQITVASVLDYETTPTYSLTLTALDTGGLTDTAAVTITVTDEDERPHLTPDPEGRDWVVGSNQEFEVANTVGVQSVTVSETGDDRTGDLTIRATEAGITCETQVNSLSVDTASSFWARFCDAGTLTLRVEDNADSTNFREYTMTLAQNRAPSFSSDTTTRSVNENAAAGANVGTPVTAADADSDPVTYSLSGSTLFSIVSGTGQIQVANGASINYEVATSHTVTVTAQDNALESDTITVTINVVDLDDAPQLTPDPSTVTADLNTNQQFTVSLPTNAHPTQNVTVTTADGTGEMKLRATEEGLTCETTITTLSVASDGSFYARFCDAGTATLSVAPTSSAVDVREYAVTITVPATAPAQVTGLVATAGPGAEEVSLVWVAPNNGGSDITHYEYALFYIGYEFVGTWYSTGSTSTSHVVTGLTSIGVPHQFWVRAVNDIETGPSSTGSNKVAPGGLPGAPTGLSATAGELQVSLSWTAGAANFGTLSRYEYSSDDGTTWRTTGGTDTSYTATQTSAVTPAGLVGGTEYTFRVRGVNQFGNGAASASAAATPEASATHPDAITDLTATHGNASVTLNWTVPGDGGSTITSYDYSSDNGITWRTTGSSSNEYAVTNTSHSPHGALANGTAYTFQVRARNAEGAGNGSNAVTETPRTTPGNPTSLVVTPMDGRVGLVWVAPNSGGTDITGYDYTTDGGTTWASTGSAAASHTVTQTSAAAPANLVNGTEYQFAVRAVNSEGNGPASSVVNGTPREAATAPGQPTPLTATPGDAQVRLTWTAPSNGGSIILRYEYSSDNGTTWATTGSADTEDTVTQTSAATPANLANGTAYSFRVRAVNAIGAGPQSAAANATPRPPSEPSAPTGFTATAGLAQVALSWTAPTVDHDETITDYQYSSDNGATWRSTGSTSTSYTATQTSSATTVNLTLGTAYTFRVRAVNGAGNGAQSAGAAATPYGLPGAPSDLQASAGNAEVVLNWTAAAANGRTIADYEYSSDNGGTWRSTGSASTSYTATQTSAATPVNLVNETAYTFRVRAVNSVGTGPQSNPATVTPTSNTAPARVTGLAASPGDGFVYLEWVAPNNGGTAITTYEWQANSGFWHSTESAATSYTVTSLNNGTVYSFRIRARNKIGYGPESAAQTTTPNNQPPAFARDRVTRNVEENQGVGANVGAVVTAADPESDTIAYSITGANTAGFTVSSSGQIQTGQVLDHEAADSYTVTLRASATGGSDTITVTINVGDVNEAPSFASGSATRRVPENSGANTNVDSAVSATDVDSGDTLRYTLLNGSGRFTIVSATGRIRVASGAGLDYETTQSYQVTVRVTDRGGLYDEVSVTINLDDVNEAPSFASGSANRTVPENSVANTNVGGAVTAADPEGDTLQYTLSNGGGRFTVVSDTGQIQVASGAGLDYETTRSYQVTVRATDNAGLYDEVSVTIAVTDVVEAPRFAAPSYTRRIAEDAGPGANVGAAIVATNANGMTFTYSLSGDGVANFAVNASGQVTVSASARLDHETASSYSLTIQAATSNGTATAALVIAVTDVDEPPAFPADTATRTIVETAGGGDPAGDPVTAVDPESAVINYSLSGPDASSFDIDSLTGQIMLAPGVGLDPVTKPSYSVTVTARDTGNNTDSILVTINVKDVRSAVAAAAVSVGRAYLGTIHLVVGNGGTWSGYQANGYGGLTSGRLPAVLFTDHADRPLELAAINASNNQLRLRYADTETGLLKTGHDLEWLRVQVRAADNSILAAGNLWNASGCVDRTLCLNVGANIRSQNTNAVALDFFDASAEALEASSGGVMSILLVAEETATDATGFDDSAGDHIAGHVLSDWMLDGEERDIDQLFVRHGASGRVVEVHYSAASPTGQWRSDPDEYKRWRLTLRDRAGEMLLQVRLRDALAAMSEANRRCGDATPQRRLCIRYDDDFDGATYRGQVVLVQIEDVRGIALIEEVPGGPVGGQIMLTLFGGVLAGFKGRRLRSPVREAVILVFMAFGAMILPFMGIGNLFWAGGILVLAAVAAAAVFFMRAK